MIRKNKKQEANKFSWDDSSNQTVGQFVKYLDNIQVKIRINGTKVYCEIPKKYYSPPNENLLWLKNTLRISFSLQ